MHSSGPCLHLTPSGSEWSRLSEHECNQFTITHCATMLKLRSILLVIFSAVNTWGGLVLSPREFLNTYILENVFAEPLKSCQMVIQVK